MEAIRRLIAMTIDWPDGPAEIKTGKQVRGNGGTA
jgi:hypothetical protein